MERFMNRLSMKSGIAAFLLALVMSLPCKVEAVIVINGMHGQGEEMGWLDIENNPWNPEEPIVIVGTITAEDDQVINEIVTIGEEEGRDGCFTINIDDGNDDITDNADIVFQDVLVENGRLNITIGSARFNKVTIDHYDGDNPTLNIESDGVLFINEDDDNQPGEEEFVLIAGAVSIEGRLQIEMDNNDILELSGPWVGGEDTKMEIFGEVIAGHLVLEGPNLFIIGGDSNLEIGMVEQNGYGPLTINGGTIHCLGDYNNGEPGVSYGGNIVLNSGTFEVDGTMTFPGEHHGAISQYFEIRGENSNLDIENDGLIEVLEMRSGSSANIRFGGICNMWWLALDASSSLVLTCESDFNTISLFMEEGEGEDRSHSC